MRFAKTRRGIAAEPDDVERDLLRRLGEDLLALLGDAEPAPGTDPLQALVGLTDADPERPADPALARLLPDAYGAADPEASAEFRRYTELDLRAGKRAAAQRLLRTLPEDGPVRLDRADADAWLGCLNDLRLVLGTRLAVTEDLDVRDLPEDDPRLPALSVYGWLGWLQESLLEAMTPRRR